MKPSGRCTWAYPQTSRRSRSKSLVCAALSEETHRVVLGVLGFLATVCKADDVIQAFTLMTDNEKDCI